MKKKLEYVIFMLRTFIDDMYGLLTFVTFE